ncbi:hypothetical protein DH2020_006437 [Rehmannia glutinosa]|uniref:DUF676 domain-containing protein n=1 Tax=Rehmannia glutinosa TaxID=99300 RepID=A0ABR0XJ10_REHGL
MITTTKIPFQPTIANTKPTSNSRISNVVVNFHLGFAKRSRNRGGCRRWWVDERGEMEFIREMSVGCFKGCSSKKERKVEIESANGGEDVFDAAAAEARVQPDHLVIMVNGIIGSFRSAFSISSAADWRYAAEQFVKNLPDKVIVHRSECNPSRLTFDGVDKMGERLAEEVIDVIRRWGVHKISFVAHSLGGLVARYAIGRLYKLPAKMGSSGLLPGYCSNGEPNIAATTLWSSVFGKKCTTNCTLDCWKIRKHLFLTDNDDGKPPLLLRMVNDSDDLHFISALRSFRRRVAYANANYDLHWIILPPIRLQSNLLMSDVNYPHIVHVERGITEDGTSKASSAVGTQVIDLEDNLYDLPHSQLLFSISSSSEEMIRGLTQVSWERVDVSFHKSRQRYVAHNTIQVKSYWLNSDGADVVQHMIDNFLL